MLVDQLQFWPIELEMNNVGMTLFAYACANTNNYAILNTILHHSPNIFTVDATFRTALHHAVRKLVPPNDVDAILSNVSLVQFLVESGVDREARTMGGETPLMDCVRGGNIKILEILLNGAC